MADILAAFRRPNRSEESKGNEMNETELLARMMRMTLRLEQQDAAYAELLQRLAWVVSGEVDRSRVMVNLTDRTWAISEPGTRPATPATINGLPVVVVAPEPPVFVPPEPVIVPNATTLNGLPEPEPKEHPRPEPQEPPF